MGINTKGKRKFNFNGIEFVWWVSSDIYPCLGYLSIISIDKKMEIGYAFESAKFIEENPDYRSSIYIRGKEFYHTKDCEEVTIECSLWESLEETITPKIVRKILHWSFAGEV